jgi:AraC family transcriptional regulator of adaptative response / DNA-3-methyladenine glycosylase II
MNLDPEICYRAWVSRDRRFDGRFFMGVTSTGIYCRPGCPARVPARHRCEFYASPAAAEAAGFRPCKRCRPESSPGSAAALGTSVTVTRALRLIDEGALDTGSVEQLGARLGVTDRWLRELFTAQVGASPLQVALTRRVHLAKQLLETSDLALEDIALAAGFGGARQLRAAVQQTFRCAPSTLRGKRMSTPGVSLRIAARAPFDPAPLLGFLATRAIPGVEEVQGGVYRRTAWLGSAATVVAMDTAAEQGAITLRLSAALPHALLAAVARATRVFDLHTDAAEVAAQLRASEPLFARLLRGRSLRVPGAWDPFELGVRALLGQQVTVAGARTVATRLVHACGQKLPTPEGALTHLFPTPEAVAGAPLETLGMPGARARALRGFARAVADGALDLQALGGLDDAVAALTALPGIGDWTAQYIAMRALGEPDAFPAGDLAVRKAIARGGARLSERQAVAHAERWRPFRAYATFALWTLETDRSHAAAPKRRKGTS